MNTVSALVREAFCFVSVVGEWIESGITVFALERESVGVVFISDLGWFSLQEKNAVKLISKSNRFIHSVFLKGKKYLLEC